MQPPMELFKLAWELRRPNAVTWELQSSDAPGLSFDDMNIMPFTTVTLLSALEYYALYHSESAFCADSRAVKA